MDLGLIEGTAFHHRFEPGSSDAKNCLVLLHGTGGDESQLIEFGRAIDPNAHLLGLRGRSNEEGRNRFFRRYGEGVFDEHDIKMQCHDLCLFLAIALKQYHVDATVTALGFSNGANMAASMMLLYPSVFERCLLFRSILPIMPEILPDLNGKSIFMVNGDEDSLGPQELAENLARLFRECGAEVEARLIHGKHALTQTDVQLASAWINSQS